VEPHNQKEESTMEKNTESIVEQIKSLLAELRDKGVSEEQIAALVQKQAGTIILDPKGYLYLPENGNIKVRLTPIERTLYTLVLRYPEGVPVDELWRYYDELCIIYGKQTVYDDPEMIRNAIEALCDDYKTTLYTNISRIKKKFTDKLGEMTAKPYIISRDTDGRYRIPIDRALVKGL